VWINLKSVMLSKRNQMQKARVSKSMCMKCPDEVTAQRGWDSFWGDENVLELDNGDTDTIR
jgi:hypothetical protein